MKKVSELIFSDLHQILDTIDVFVFFWNGFDFSRFDF